MAQLNETLIRAVFDEMLKYKPSLTNYTWLIRSVGNIFSKSKLEWFMPEMGERFDKNFYEALDFWVPERNEIGHYQINLTQEDIEKRCVEYEEKLTRKIFLCTPNSAMTT